MHQDTHDTTEAELLAASNSWDWWSRTCEYWRETCQKAQRERDLARAHAAPWVTMNAIITLAEQKRCDFQILSEYDEAGNLMLGWRVEGPRGMNNANMGFINLINALDEMLEWLETCEHKPSPVTFPQRYDE